MCSDQTCQQNWCDQHQGVSAHACRMSGNVSPSLCDQTCVTVLRHPHEALLDCQSSHMMSTTHADYSEALHTGPGQLHTRNGREWGGRRRRCAEGPGGSFLQADNLLQLTSHFGFPSCQHALMRFEPKPELCHGSIIGGLVHLQVASRRQLMLINAEYGVVKCCLVGLHGTLQLRGNQSSDTNLHADNHQNTSKHTSTHTAH